MVSRRRRRSAVTLRAVAEQAGVSAMTVSNVVNGRGKVGPETIDRVKAVIAELGYVPNAAARQLVGARSAKIGLIYAEDHAPLLERILVAALQATADRGLQLLVRGGRRQTQQEAVVLARELVGAGADALLILPPYAELLSGAPLFASLDVPAAAIGSSKPLPDMATIRIDARAAMRDVTRLLIKRGHRRIGCVTGPYSHADSRERLSGFREAFQEAGILFPKDLVVDGSFTFDSGAQAAAILLSDQNPPSAIAAVNDDMAAGVVAEAQRRGFKLPEQLAVTGFDDTNLAGRIWPPLTAVRQPCEEMTMKAIGLLIDALEGTREGSSIDELMPHQIVERESTSFVH